MTVAIIVGSVLGGVTVIGTICAFAWYRIVDPSEAHLVATSRGTFVVSPDEKINTNGKRSYFAIPSSIPFVGRALRVMDMTIKELVVTQETYEKNQARYNVRSSTKYRITNVGTAAERFVDDEDLQKQLVEVVNAGVRAVTVKYDVIEARANKQKMSEEIQNEISDDLSKWGLELVNFQLVDFQDTPDSTIISDISKRREIEIKATTREQNAEKLKQARIKEAEAEEKAKEREIAKERVIGECEENKKQKISEQQKIAEEKRFEVVQVQTIKQANIDKEKAIILANQNKETEAIMKEQKQLEGEGDKIRAMERAKGEAAPIREKGLAEAEAKEKLQAALNKFKPEAIRALTAELIVEKDKAVGIATAGALEKADLKVFSGGGDSKGFDLGRMISSLKTADESSANAILNNVARPNDLGLTTLGLATKAMSDAKDAKKGKKQVQQTKAE